MMTILEHGTEYQKEKFLKPLLNGEERICFSMTEKAAGADATGMQTTAVKDGNENYILNGEKWFSSSASVADMALVMAKTDPNAPRHRQYSTFIVELPNPGYKIKRNIANMAIEGPHDGHARECLAGRRLAQPVAGRQTIVFRSQPAQLRVDIDDPPQHVRRQQAAFGADGRELSCSWRSSRRHQHVEAKQVQFGVSCDAVAGDAQVGSGAHAAVGSEQLVGPAPGQRAQGGGEGLLGGQNLLQPVLGLAGQHVGGRHSAGQALRFRAVQPVRRPRVAPEAGQQALLRQHRE